jgi:sugar phosphate isomerase/epimerase
MIYPGLVSITFRQLTPTQVIELVTQAGLVGIEWGGDIHVPHGDLVRAREVRRQTEAAGLQTAAYGSYYRVGHVEPVLFETVLDTAVELGAPVIRVWAGKQGSAASDEAYRQRIAEDSRRIAELAAQAKIGIAYEFHAKTLMDTAESARQLLESVAHDNLSSYWQPPRYWSLAQNLAGLKAVFPWLSHVHVFKWDTTSGDRLSLAAGEAEWLIYLTKVNTLAQDRFAMLEFVVNDAPQNFLQDAATLKQWLANIQKRGE